MKYSLDLASDIGSEGSVLDLIDLAEVRRNILEPSSHAVHVVVG